MEQASAAIDPRYPVGRFQKPASVSAEDRSGFIAEIEALPSRIGAAIDGFNDAQLDTPYREGGWTVRQVVHHLADSHMNSFTRFKLGLTENAPTIKPYDEGEWAKTGDTIGQPLEFSIKILDGLHQRWAALLRSLTNEQYARTFIHPEMGVMRLDMNLALYAWHCRHHTGHITSLRRRMGW